MGGSPWIFRQGRVAVSPSTGLVDWTVRSQKVGTATAGGAVVGGALTNSVGGVIAGAAIAGFGTYLLETADGQCQYRNAQGQVYTTKCHWK
jgi:hypothetical protein